MAEEEEKVTKGEIMRNAQLLVKSKGEGALDYARDMAERMQDEGNEQDIAFWERIAQQVELLIDEPYC